MKLGSSSSLLFWKHTGPDVIVSRRTSCSYVTCISDGETQTHCVFLRMLSVTCCCCIYWSTLLKYCVEVLVLQYISTSPPYISKVNILLHSSFTDTSYFADCTLHRMKVLNFSFKLIHKLSDFFNNFLTFHFHVFPQVKVSQHTFWFLLWCNIFHDFDVQNSWQVRKWLKQVIQLTNQLIIGHWLMWLKLEQDVCFD